MGLFGSSSKSSSTVQSGTVGVENLSGAISPTIAPTGNNTLALNLQGNVSQTGRVTSAGGIANESGTIVNVAKGGYFSLSGGSINLGSGEDSPTEANITGASGSLDSALEGIGSLSETSKTVINKNLIYGVVAVLVVLGLAIIAKKKGK